ncbi:MAG: alpha-D-ribose 1-methylphosphonate 5-triphosphate diphosphatase [Pseudomonadota bacterium]
MSALLPPLRFTGASILRDGEMQRRSLSIDEGRITRGPLPEVNMSGYLLLPGIVDLHGDAFERHVAPRASAPFDLQIGLASTWRDAAANGVTTGWLAQSWSWEGGRRGPDFAETLLAAHAARRAQSGTDLRVQIRCETHTTDTAERLLAAVRRWGIDYVVFNDHLPESLEELRERPGDAASTARAAGRSLEEHERILTDADARSREVPRHLCRLAEAFDDLGVTYGSHDDPDGETRERYSMIGATIAEFPTSRRAAAAAKAMNDPVLMGAPNVVRGGSQVGRIAAADLVAENLCDALVSDYYYPALAHAAWRLVDDGILPLQEAWALISTAPASILGLPDRGTLDPGRRADLVAINAETRQIEMTIAGGSPTYLSGAAASRIAHAGSGLRIAAE